MQNTNQIQEINSEFKKAQLMIKNGDFDSATKLINKLYLKSLKIDYTDGVNLYYERTILILLFTEEFFKTISFIKYLIKEYKKTKEIKKLINIYGKFGAVLSRLKDYKSSQYYLNKALKTTLELDPIPPLSVIAWHIELARNFNSQNKIKKALFLINEGLDFAQAYNQKDVETYSLFLIIDKLSYLIKLNRLKEAKVLFSKFYQEETLNDNLSKFSFDKIKIELLMQEEILDKKGFLKMVHSALKKSAAFSNKSATHDLLEILKLFHFNNNNIDLAYKYANQIIDHSQKEKDRPVSILKWHNTAPKETYDDEEEFEIYRKSELDVAAKYQQNFFSKIHLSKKLNIQTLYKPSKTLSGDYIGTFKLDDDRILLILADVVGKGITASYISFMLEGVIKAILKSSEDFNLKTIITDINDIISDTLNNEGFVSLWAGVIDTKEETLQSVNAGHLPTYVIKKDGELFSLKDGCTILGMFKNLPSLDCEIVNFGKGDIVMAISDGVIEAVGQKGNQFEKRYDTLINKFAKEKSFNLTNKLEKVLTNFQDHTQVQDDISSLFVEFNN